MHWQMSLHIRLHLHPHVHLLYDATIKAHYKTDMVSVEKRVTEQALHAHMVHADTSLMNGLQLSINIYDVCPTQTTGNVTSASNCMDLSVFSWKQAWENGPWILIR